MMVSSLGIMPFALCSSAFSYSNLVTHGLSQVILEDLRHPAGRFSSTDIGRVLIPPQEIFTPILDYLEDCLSQFNEFGGSVLEIAVLPVGPVDVEILEHICKVLQKAFPESTSLLLRRSMPLPSEAYNASRDQYDSSILLSKILPFKSEAGKMLGVTEADLYVPSMNFVFGEAHHLWGVAIVSLRRLRPEFYGQTSDNSLFLERCAKEAVHEVGHILSLSHCDDPQCVMFFSNSIRDTDGKGLSFCKRCYGEVLRILKSPRSVYSSDSR